MPYYTYTMASGRNGTLYVGMTNDIVRRAHQHRTGAVPGFTKRYKVTELVYLETYESPGEAIHREKRIKKWPRAWKLALIEGQNPDWRDRYLDLNA